MLTVELNELEQRVEIYVDDEGAKVLGRALEAVLRTQGHDHLMTPSWSGTELSEQQQGKETTLMNHLLLVYRK
jgi:hypothetical protein